MHVEFASRSVRKLPSELVEALIGFIGPKDAPRQIRYVGGFGKICVLQGLAESWS